MFQKMPTYWANLGTFFPWKYRIRTRLTDCYVLQVSGQEDGHRHRASLYLLLLTGRMRRVWSRKFYLSHDLDRDTAKLMALKVLEQAIENRTGGNGAAFPLQEELGASVRRLLDELAADREKG